MFTVVGGRGVPQEVGGEAREVGVGQRVDREPVRRQQRVDVEVDLGADEVDDHGGVLRHAEQLQGPSVVALRGQGGAVEGEDLRGGDPVAGQRDRGVGDLGNPGGRQAGVRRGLGGQLAQQVEVRRGRVGDRGVHRAAVGVQVGPVGHTAADHDVTAEGLAHVDVGAGCGVEVAADREHVAAGVRRDL